MFDCSDLVQMGVMGEMMNEAVDAAMDNNDLEEETDEEVAKVLDEILAGRRSTREDAIQFRYVVLLLQAKSVSCRVLRLVRRRCASAKQPVRPQQIMKAKKTIWSDVCKH